MTRNSTVEHAISRSRILEALRRELQARGHVEVSSPVLVRASDCDSSAFKVGKGTFVLRSSMELRLRRALAAGHTRVFEIGPCFRFGDIDETHYPEFYMLELFERDISLADLLDLTLRLAEAAAGTALKVKSVDVTAWLSHTFAVDMTASHEAIRTELVSRGLVPAELLVQPLFRSINHLVAERLEPALEGWTLLAHFPTCTVSLARRASPARHIIERFELFKDSLEIAHGFTDESVSDDVEQRMLENGVDVDPDFVELMRNGLIPQSGGVGFGIERLAMAATDQADIMRFVNHPQFGL